VQFDRVFLQGLQTHDKKTKDRALGHKKAASESHVPNRITLDDALVECFSSLSPQCPDEELEDLAYFMLDLYQFHGIQVAIAEVDITQVVVDLRTVLEEHASRLEGLKKLASRFNKNNGLEKTKEVEAEEHVFLVLDKNMQPFPWENIPILRGRSVSRIPNVSFLLDRFDRQEPIQKKKTHYFLNPSGDLVGTQGRFEPWLKKMGWGGLVGSAPSEIQFAHALENNDLVMYVSPSQSLCSLITTDLAVGTLDMEVESNIFARTRFGSFLVVPV
jgi:separase